MNWIFVSPGAEQDKFAVEFVYTPASDAEERLAESYDLILALILKEPQTNNKDGE